MRILIAISLCVAVAQTLSPLSILPPLFSSIENPLVQPSSSWGDHNRANLQTHSFFQNMVVGSGNLPVNLIPYIVNIEAPSGGLGVSVPRTKDVSWGVVRSPHIINWAIGANEGKLDHHTIVAHDKLSVTVEFKKGAGLMRAPLVRGSAFITVDVNELSPFLYTENGLMAVTLPDGTEMERYVPATSDRFILDLNCGGFWILYTNEPVTITFNPNVLNFRSAFTGTLRLAYLGTTPDNASIYDKYHEAVPISGAVSVNFPAGAKTAEVSYKYEVRPFRAWDFSSKELLMFTLQHHRDIMKNAKPVPIEFDVLKGKTSAVAGNEWVMEETMIPADWQIGRNISDEGMRKTLEEAMGWDIRYFSSDKRSSSPNSKIFGNELERLARLALIAEDLGDAARAKEAIEAIKRLITPWLEGTSENFYQYDSSWGGIVTKRGLEDKEVDGGNGIYNDHHITYGYHLYALAVVGRIDPSFIALYELKILALVRDIANPSELDTYFPVARHKDWFYWHSWGGGVEEFIDNRYVESISQGAFSYYAVALLGRVLNNSEMEQWGQLLMSMEIRAGHRYFLLEDKSIYPTEFSQYKIVGVMWDTKLDVRTFEGQNLEYSHSMQMIPFNPLSEIYLKPSYVRMQWPLLKDLPTYNEYLAYIVMDRAIIDKEGAWKQATTTKDIGYYGRQSKTNMLWWIATRP